MKLFGTDGVRGAVGDLITADLATALARAAAVDASGPAVVGRDTRVSGPMLVSAITDGLTAAGLDVFDLGVIPVGAVAMLAPSLGADLGVMVSASHNPAGDNGIKFFGPGGSKLTPEAEAAIEARLDEAPPTEQAAGRVTTVDDAVQRYVDHLAAMAVDALRSDVVIDAAHGAAHEAAPALYRKLGAAVQVINAEPDGTNINERSGAVYPEGLAAVAEGRIGLAFDGDADRCIAVDESGAVCNGDVILAVLAQRLQATGDLAGGKVVATVMANLGFRRAMDQLGIEVVETPVGDRAVLEAMAATGAVLGGEQSGHVIFGGQPTGDGLLTGLRLLEAVEASGKPLEALREMVEVVPQLLINIPVADRGSLDTANAVWEAVTAAEARLGTDGRVLVRESGTEPLVRVMVEAVDPTEAQAVADQLADIVRRELGPSRSGTLD